MLLQVPSLPFCFLFQMSLPMSVLPSSFAFPPSSWHTPHQTSKLLFPSGGLHPSPAPLPPFFRTILTFFFFPNYVHYYRTFHFRGQENGGDTKKKKNVAIWPAYQDQSVLHRCVKHRRTLHSRCCTNNEPKLKRKAFLPPPQRGPALRSWRLSYGQLDTSIQ